MATTIGSDYAEQTARLSAANKDAVWVGSLSNDFLRTLVVPTSSPRSNTGPPLQIITITSLSLCISNPFLLNLSRLDLAYPLRVLSSTR
jgi:hypothetical protein